MQEAEIWSYLYNPESVQENETHKFLKDFRDTNGSPNPGQTTRFYNNQQKKKKKWTCGIKRMWKDWSVLQHYKGTEKAVNHESVDNTNRDWFSW